MLTGNLHPQQRERYTGTDGLSRMVADFYSCQQKPDGSSARWRGKGALVVDEDTSGGEPEHFREPRDTLEAESCASEIEQERLFQNQLHRRGALSHKRPGVFRGHTHTLFPDPGHNKVPGYINRGDLT
ncbi:hypothetical protein [Marinobacter sp.]|uniref:hypothetical protein n=1 Tax=Marinobacter sp. TaxID=50741 RepID=UPI001B49DAA0|nr:hypothetical protein [Marinobacter sp.]MBQ0831637.1 hypothetical protein [Marinobacter sp.]